MGTKRELLTKAQDSTDPKYGCKPSERPAQEYIRYGTINLDKPAGPTSHEVAAWVKRICTLKQLGTAGLLTQSHRHFTNHAGRCDQDGSSIALQRQRIRLRYELHAM